METTRERVKFWQASDCGNVEIMRAVDFTKDGVAKQLRVRIIIELLQESDRLHQESASFPTKAN